MPATYTYNDAIDDAIRVVVKSWEDNGDHEKKMGQMLEIVGKLSDLKRPSRRKRKLSSPGSEG